MPKSLPLPLVVLLAVACSGGREPAGTLTLATTTSTRDSGLLEELIPQFEKDSGIEVKVVAVGSGAALALGRRGDADLLLTHAPEEEEKFIAAGHGTERIPVMTNDFVLLGPADDPAEIKQAPTLAAAFAQLARGEGPFVSRDDDSGTHQKEEALWRHAQIRPQGSWYLRAGTGMAAALQIASEKQAYTLCDRATFLAHRNRLDLQIHAAGDPMLRNPYCVILVSPQKHSRVNFSAARQFAEHLTSPRVQQQIGRFGVAPFGQPLFHPQAAPNPEKP